MIAGLFLFAVVGSFGLLAALRPRVYGLVLLAVVLSGLSGWSVVEDTAECRIESAPDSAITSTKGMFVGRLNGRNFTYSFAVNGQAYTGRTWGGGIDLTALRSGDSVDVLYDSRNPSVSANGDFQMICGENRFLALGTAVVAVLLRLLVSAVLTLIKRRDTRHTRHRELPRFASFAADMQKNLLAIVAAASLTVAYVFSRYCTYPGGLEIAAILQFVVLLWAVMSGNAILRGSRRGWIVSVIGNALGLGLVLAQAVQHFVPAQTVTSLALFVSILVLLLKPDVRRFYFDTRSRQSPV